MKTTTFNSGIPTEPDVNRLREKFGSPVVGTIITWEQIEETINTPKQSSRFRSVVTAWRAKLWREHNILLGPIPSIGLKALNPTERIHHSGKKYKNNLRGISRAATIADSTAIDELSEDELKVRDHISRAGAAIRLAAATEAKRISFNFSKKT